MQAGVVAVTAARYAPDALSGGYLPPDGDVRYQWLIRRAGRTVRDHHNRYPRDITGPRDHSRTRRPDDISGSRGNVQASVPWQPVGNWRVELSEYFRLRHRPD